MPTHIGESNLFNPLHQLKNEPHLKHTQTHPKQHLTKRLGTCGRVKLTHKFMCHNPDQTI